MENQNEKPNYYAIIPAEVRYANIPPMAKLLFGEITALSNKNAFCWATNSYFASLYKMADISISRLIDILNANGFIHCEYDYTEENRKRRKIYINNSLNKNEHIQKCLGYLNKNDKASLNKNDKYNNTSMNNTSEYIKVSKKEAEAMSYNKIIKTYFADTEMQNVMTEFIKMRKMTKRPITNYGLKLICDKLIKDYKQEEWQEVVQQSIMNNWQNIYPLKKQDTKKQIQPNKILDRNEYDKKLMESMK